MFGERVVGSESPVKPELCIWGYLMCSYLESVFEFLHAGIKNLYLLHLVFGQLLSKAYDS